MTRRVLYLDTSAVAKLVSPEPETPTLAAFLDAAAADDDLLVSSVLLVTELHRLVARLDLDRADAAAVLDRLALADADRGLFITAGLLPVPALRSLDALHLATAVRLGVDAVVAYDRRLLDGAGLLGLATLSPSSP